MTRRFDGIPRDSFEFMPQRGLFLAQLADVYKFAADRDSENRIGTYTGEQFLYHNAPEVREPVTARMDLEPVSSDSLLHGVRELSVYIPEEEHFWSAELPLFCFTEVTALNNRKFVYGVTDRSIEEFAPGDQLVAKWDFDDKRTVFELVLGSIPAREDDEVIDDEVGPLIHTDDRKAYLNGLVGALSECVHDYGLRSQRRDTSLK